VTEVIVAFAASLPLGVGLGVVGATCARGSVRPCRRLLDHGLAAVSSGTLLALAATATIAAAATRVGYRPALLAAMCCSIALLVGAAVWLFLVEADDGDALATDDDPEWWPTFERELDEWSRRARVLSR